MLNNPPIDELIEKAGCKYALTNAIAKRARVLLAQDQDVMANSNLKCISYAAIELYEDKIKIVKE